MNEADPSPINLDELRLVPDWLREEGPPPSKQYASHAGGDADGFGPRRGSRPGTFNRDRPPGRASGGSVGGRSDGDRRRDAGRPAGPPPRGGAGRPIRDERRPAPEASTAPAPVRVEFLPDEKCLASITKQIRATHMAYPLFGLARMFLQEPARHWVQFTLIPDAQVLALYQLGEDGPVTHDRSVLERIAYDAAKDRYYVEQSEQKEAPKGNYTNVARNRLSGVLLGPTNYHGYQPALRADYESRYGRRMSFEDYRRNIEVVNDPALVERWKEEARTTTTIATREIDPPVILATASDARVHFRQHYFDELVRTGTTFKVHGSVARNLPEPAMMQAIRQAHDTELRYPAQFVQQLRQGLQNAGLHIFKHRKRVVYVSLSRPLPFAPDGAVSENVAAILDTVAQFPLCNRKLLAARVLSRKFETPDETAVVEHLPKGELSPVPAENVVPTRDDTSSDTDASTEQTPAVEEVLTENATSPEQIAPAIEDPLAKPKAALAADLRFLVQSGHLIEFHNGTFDLPLSPKVKGESAPNARSATPTPAPLAMARTELAADAVMTDPAAVEAERDELTVESVTILAPAAAEESEITTIQESGSEKTEASIVSETDIASQPGLPGTAPHPTPPEQVIMGDAESAHPLSPL